MRWFTNAVRTLRGLPTLEEEARHDHIMEQFEELIPRCDEAIETYRERNTQGNAADKRDVTENKDASRSRSPFCSVSFGIKDDQQLTLSCSEGRVLLSFPQESCGSLSLHLKPFDDQDVEPQQCQSTQRDSHENIEVQIRETGPRHFDIELHRDINRENRLKQEHKRQMLKALDAKIQSFQLLRRLNSLASHGYCSKCLSSLPRTSRGLESLAVLCEQCKQSKTQSTA